MFLSLPQLKMFSVNTPLSLLSRVQRENIYEEESALVQRWANYSPQISRIHVAHAYSEAYSEEDYYSRDPFLCGRQELYHKTEDEGEVKWVHTALYNPHGKVGPVEITNEVSDQLTHLVTSDRLDRFH